MKYENKKQNLQYYKIDLSSNIILHEISMNVCDKN